MFVPEAGRSKWWKSTGHFLEKDTEALSVFFNCHVNSILCCIKKISLSKWFALTVFIDVKVGMARLQMLREKEKVEFINC